MTEAQRLFDRDVPDAPTIVLATVADEAVVLPLMREFYAHEGLDFD
jgi:hypothetical protein